MLPLTVLAYNERLDCIIIIVLLPLLFTVSFIENVIISCWLLDYPSMSGIYLMAQRFPERYAFIASLKIYLYFFIFSFNCKHV